MARYARDYDRLRPRGPGYDMAFGNWESRSGLRGYDPGYRSGWGMTGLYRNVLYGEEYEELGQEHNPYVRTGMFTGMESNRRRGVYGSDFRVGYDTDLARHGGYRGTRWNRGGGMNPGRRPYDRGWF